MSVWARLGVCCLLAVILSEAAFGQTPQPGCQIQGSAGSVTCKTCDSTNTSCTECFDGFQRDTTKSPVECVACSDECLLCNTTTSPCTQCANGYGPDPANVGACGQCATPAENCEGICDQNGPGKCDICMEGFGVGTAKTCEPCPDHCKTCGQTSTSICDLCMEGYTLTDGQCFESASTTLRTTPGGPGGSTTPIIGGPSGPTTQGGGGPGGSTTQGGGGPGGSTTQAGGSPGSPSTQSGGPGGSSTQVGGGSGGPSTQGGGEPGASTVPGDGGDGGLSDGEKAGIIIGVVCGVLALLFACLLAWLLCRWRPFGGGYVEERPSQVYQEPMPYYTSLQQPATRPSYYPWNRHFSQDHSHGDAAHAHRVRHLEFS